MDIAMPALLGYFMTMLYNPNNVTLEVSPLTTIAEVAVGNDLCDLFGYNTDPGNTELPLAWGHIVSGGSIANLESMWMSRNLKYYPLSIRWAMKDDGPLAFIANDFKLQPCVGKLKLFAELETWELLNLKANTILDIPERLRSGYHISQGFLDSVMKQYGVQSVGKSKLEREFGVPDMVYYVSNTRHYSWPKGGGMVRFEFASFTKVDSDYNSPDWNRRRQYHRRKGRQWSENRSSRPSRKASKIS